jgi:hypothetical protein
MEHDEKVKIEVENLKSFLNRAFLLERLSDFPGVSECFCISDSDDSKIKKKP